MYTFLKSILVLFISIACFLSPTRSYTQDNSNSEAIETEIYFEKEFINLLSKDPNKALLALYSEYEKLESLKALITLEEEKAANAKLNFETTYKGNIHNMQVSSKIFKYSLYTLIGYGIYTQLVVGILGERTPELGQQKLKELKLKFSQNPKLQPGFKDVLNSLRLQASSNPKILKNVKRVFLPASIALVGGLIAFNENFTFEMKMDERNLNEYANLLAYLKLQIANSENRIKSLESLADVQKKLREIENQKQNSTQIEVQ